MKVYGGLSRSSFEAIVDEAHRQQLLVVGHVVPSVGILDGVAHSQTAVEHAADLLLPVSGKEEQFRRSRGEGRPVRATEVVRTFSEKKAKRLAQHFRDHKVRLVPTLALVAKTLETAATGPAAVNAASLRFVPPAYVREWRSAKPLLLEDAEAQVQGAMRIVKHMIDARVDILAGTDVVKSFFVPGQSLHDELTLLVNVGLTPVQALRAATIAPANYLRIQDSGTVSSGQRADLVLLTANPLQDINNTRRIAGVMADGTFCPRQAVEDMLRHIERAAASWKGTPTGQ